MLRRMRRAVWVLGIALSSVQLAVACGGSSDDDGGSGGKATGGAAGSGGSATSGGGVGGGSGGTSPSGGASGAAGNGGSAGVDASSGGSDAGTDASPDSSIDAPIDAVSDATATEIDFDPTTITESASAFPSGIQAGDVTWGGAMIWTYYAGTSPLVLRVYKAGTAGKVSLYHESTVTPSADGYVHVDVPALPPHSELFYVFLQGAAPAFSGRSAVGRLVTAPMPGQKPVARFGGTSCADNSKAPFPALEKAGAEKFDFFILAGDTTYNDSATTLSQYRAKWLGQVGQSTYRSLLSSTGNFATWDDHEVANDWNPETIDKTRLANATQAFFEHLPVRRHTSEANRIWRSASWGDTLEIFVLDSRSERKPSTASGPNAQYLSPAQLSWLQSGLVASTATFKIIVTSVPITNMPALWDLYAVDRWEGYPAQRKKLLDHITSQNIKGVLFVSGDFHLGASAAVEPSGPGSALREVLMGPAGQSGNPLVATLPASQFEFKTGTNNYVSFVADPNASPPTIQVTFIDGDAKKLFEKTYAF
jgi:alkaline phosphatase D